ncbi:MAG TPA: hypothetical protein VGS20_13035 [Candidatus Acidoferrales bacterium]|nr:hypothetical protein [Candidatus Acidoferrales bacterium]
MDCGRYQADLSAVAAGGGLAAEARRVLEEHLRRCPKCSEGLERRKRALEAIDCALAETASAAPSPELVRGLERQLAEPPPPPALSFGAVTAATLALAIAAGTWLAQDRFRRQALPVAPGTTSRTSDAARAAVSGPSRGSTTPLEAGATGGGGIRLVRRRALRPETRILEPARAPAERDAVVRLYRLLESRQVDARSLQPAAAAEDADIAVAPLRMRPLAIPPLEIDSPSNAPEARAFDESHPVADSEAQKETKR